MTTPPRALWDTRVRGSLGATLRRTTEGDKHDVALGFALSLPAGRLTRYAPSV